MVNERLVEHVARVVDADFWFEVPALRLAGRDSDRGEIYLRYGQPDAMWRDIDANVRTWFWSYGMGRAGETYRFRDLYLNGTYVRARRTIGDVMHPELLAELPQRSLVDFGPRPHDWREVVRLLRAADGRTAVELAYGFASSPAPESLRVEIAAWRAAGRRAAHRSLVVPASDLYRLGADRFLGRLRFDVPSEWLEIGLEVVATGAGGRYPALWTAMRRDTIDALPYEARSVALSDLVPAHVLSRSGAGRAFDFGGTFVVPRVENEIARGTLHLYFEIYPGEDVLQARQTLFVTHRVQPQAPSRWRFRDQFSSAARARRNRRTAVESTFMLQPRRPVEKQELTIDVANLEPGEYKLTVEVQPYGDQHRVARTLAFSIPAKNQRPPP
jgi:hypothetical protein